MKKGFIILFLILFKNICPAQSNDTIPLKDIEGKWYIHLSNFPMWLKGNKTHPAFNYSIEEMDGKIGLKDVVTYKKNNKNKSLEGFDKITDNTNKSFVWKGKGILGLFKSKWKIIYFDAEKKQMIIHFEKTLFTPEGYDIISREKLIDMETKKEMLSRFKDLGLKEELTFIPQD